MRTNKRPERCGECGAEVAPGAGVLLGPAGGWKTLCDVHRPTPPPRGAVAAWAQRGLAAFDLETTGIDPASDRIVSIGLIDETDREYSLVVDPGVPIPERAAEVHGIRDADVAGAVPAAQGVAWLAEWISVAIDRGVPLVVYNAPYDLSMLRAEMERHGLEPLDWERLLVLDPMVVDWGIEKGRFGPRKLTQVCEYYEVALDDAHDSLADARAARSVAREMASRHQAVREIDSIMAAQRGWFADRTEDWNAYAAKNNRSLDDPEGWPLLTS